MSYLIHESDFAEQLDELLIRVQAGEVVEIINGRSTIAVMCAPDLQTRPGA